MLIKKWSVIFLGLLLSTINYTSFAKTSTLTAFQRCGSDEFPLRNGFLFVTNMKQQFFISTDEMGNFILDDEHDGKSVLAYLANKEEVIFPGCRSDVTVTSKGRVVLYGLCPSRNCHEA